MSRTSTFRGVCAESHPKLVGLFGWPRFEIGGSAGFSISIFDKESNGWLQVRLSDFPESGDDDSYYSCFGGLVCFVPNWYNYSSLDKPILVCNPLTDTWRALPPLPPSNNTECFLVLVVDLDMNSYKVVVVHEVFQPIHSYDSGTGLWSTTNSGIVYSSFFGCLEWWDRTTPGLLVFNCTMKRLHAPPVKEVRGIRGAISAFVKNRIFASRKVDGHADSMFSVSEYACRSQGLDVNESLDLKLSIVYGRRAEFAIWGKVTTLCKQ